MLPFVCLVATILISALGVQGGGIHHIVGGTKATQCEFPHIAFIRIKKDGKTYACGGSLIDDKHVLTAAHCVEGDSKSVVVYFGSLNKLTMPMSIPVARFDKHSAFKHIPGSVVNDVAVLTLSKPVTFTTCLKPIRMANPGEQFVGDCTIAGWGRPNYKSPSSDILLRADVPILEEKKCMYLFPGILSQHICAGQGGMGGRTTCKGDSGGPLMCTSAVDGVRVLAGTVSFGWKCYNGISVFAKVTAFLPWINSVRKS